VTSLLCGLLLAAVSASAQSDVFINLAGRSGQAQTLALGMPPFLAENPARGEDALAAKQLRDVVRDDLLLSRYFSIVEDGPAFNGANLKDIAPQWKARPAGWLLTAKVGSAGKLTLNVGLVDLNSGDTVFERYYRQDAAFPRSLAHRVADDLVLALTGKNGIAHTFLAFANDNTGQKEIYLVDYDGANLRPLPRNRALSLLPRISPDRKSVVYTSYKDGNPDLFIFDLTTGKNRALSAEQGLNLAGGFSPDGTQLLMTLSRQKSPNLYLKSLADGSVTRLTQHFGADSSPTFSPDGAQVAFISDRSGNPQIHLMDLNTQRVKRLTNLNWCDSPAWSPTGEWIAFAGRAHNKDKMDIFLVDVTGNQLRQLTHGEGSNEDPTWAPDGRFLAFTSSRNTSPGGGRRQELFVMDSDGSAPHKLADLPGRCYTPNWSY
jgi:TolB protein